MRLSLAEHVAEQQPLTYALLSGNSRAAAAQLQARPRRCLEEEVVRGFTPLFAAVLAGSDAGMVQQLAASSAQLSAPLPSDFSAEVSGCPSAVHSIHSSSSVEAFKIGTSRSARTGLLCTGCAALSCPALCSPVQHYGCALLCFGAMPA